MPMRRPVHRPPGVLTGAERRAQYDRTRTRSKVYDTARWRYRLRRMYLAAHPLCECEANDGAGCGYPAEIVDHKVPHNDDPNLAFDQNNLCALTKACHDRKTAARDGGFGNPVKR
jgi:5-methylcytosine-specific restriction protein A